MKRKFDQTYKQLSIELGNIDMTSLDPGSAAVKSDAQ